MQPWKMFIRSVSVVTVLTAGGFAAGQAVVPFVNTSRNASPVVEEEAPDTEAPTVDPAAEVDETDATTTPETDAPSVDPVDDPAPKPAEEAPAEEAPAKEAPAAVTPIDVTAAPVADPAPEAPKAKKAKPAKKAKKAKSEKVYDHNGDCHADNGWVKSPNKPQPPQRLAADCDETKSSQRTPAPAAAPADTPQDKGRSEDAPGHVKDGGRATGLGHGQSKKGL